MGCGISCGRDKGGSRMGLYGGYQALLITDPPRCGRIDWVKTTAGEITILTRDGVQNFSKWMRTKDFKTIMPPLAPHPKVPFLAGGVPDIPSLKKMYNFIPEGQLRARLAAEAGGPSLFCTPRQEEAFVVNED
ncbi:hypothetical protein, conserved [Eimeria brunetti]|uniref:Uncharacterized protein n=1 Tax=Eimeria brunetti TaxID=51314 RepID=U6LBR6_9EIME|nr:hypothetical protein, conserved [Eimeria brunetti]